MTCFEYLKNELDHAEKLAKTLPEKLDRELFTIHAERLAERLGAMTPAEGGKLVFDEE